MFVNIKRENEKPNQQIVAEKPEAKFADKLLQISETRSVLIASTKFFETDDEDENTDWDDDMCM